MCTTVVQQSCKNFLVSSIKCLDYFNFFRILANDSLGNQIQTSKTLYYLQCELRRVHFNRFIWKILILILATCQHHELQHKGQGHIIKVKQKKHLFLSITEKCMICHIFFIFQKKLLNFLLILYYQIKSLSRVRGNTPNHPKPPPNHPKPHLNHPKPLS